MNSAKAAGPDRDHDELERISRTTLGHYGNAAQAYWEHTLDHDVSQNIEALLDAIDDPESCAILDLGCGPGRDLRTFRSRGHEAVGLDGCREFVDMARAYSGCEVLHQDFLALDLRMRRFDGVFANAALFHVPSRELARVLGGLRAALKPRGVLFSSNPRGNDEEGWSGDRYCCFYSLKTWRKACCAAGFEEIGHYYRPSGLPRRQQPWLATLWRKG